MRRDSVVVVVVVVVIADRADHFDAAYDAGRALITSIKVGRNAIAT
jgi:hypothetical protein